jgi:rhodanese-related sulfurtransferase/rubrerythrin
MGLVDYFKPVSTMTAEEVRALLRERDAASYNLVDVRQPGEYESGHIPGARLIPVAELPDRLDELDRSMPTITYCRAGVRSRAAAAIIEGAGFPQVRSMSGGINAWNGLVAEGGYESELAYFSGASNADELITLSIAIEEGNRVYYERLSRESGHGEAASTFRALGLAEERHKETLRKLRAILSSKDDLPAPPEGTDAGGFLEDGTPVDAALDRMRGMSTRKILEAAIAMEANAMDRYIKMGRAVSDERSRKVFLALAEEERGHVDRMAALLDRMQG